MKQKSHQGLVLTLCFAAYALVYTGRLNLSIASPLLQSGGILGKEQIGILGSTFFFVYGIGRVINGSIGDRVPPKPFLAVGLFMSALCNIGIALFPPTWCMYIIWGLNGFFQSMLWGAALRNVSLVYPEKTIAKRAAMILSASVGVGNLLAIVLATFCATIGIRPIFLVPGILMSSMSIILFFLLPSTKEAPTTQTKANFSCLRNPMLLRMLIPAMTHGIIKENVTLWIPLLFVDMYGLNLADVAFYIFLMPLATLLGRLIFPFWYRICKMQEKATLLSAFAICALALAPFLFTKPSILVSATLLAIVSVTTSVINAELLSVYPVNFQEVNQVSTVAGVLDCATYVGSAIGSAVFGYLILYFGYTSMILVWVVLAVLAILSISIKRKSHSIA